MELITQTAGVKGRKAKAGRAKEDEFLYVPSIGVYVAKKVTLLGVNCYQAHDLLRCNKERMPNLPEFVEFLKYCRSDFPEIYAGFTENKDLVRGAAMCPEWIDISSTKKGGKLHINSRHILDKEENLVPQVSERIFGVTLMNELKEDSFLPCYRQISLDSWLENSTEQGLPSREVGDGSFRYYFPRGDNSFGVFWPSLQAGSLCFWDPRRPAVQVGVRAVREER